MTSREYDVDDATLGARLRELTQWTGPATTTWASALEAGSARRPRTRMAFPSRRRALHVLLAGAVACASVALAVLAALPSVRHRLVVSESVQALPQSAAQAGSAFRGADGPSKARPEDGVWAAIHEEGLMGVGGAVQQEGAPILVERGPEEALLEDIAGLDPAERDVVRTAMLELETTDVRELFTRISALPVAADGEFVSDARFDAPSSSGGAESESSPRATVVLRVRSERLAAVLDQLRGLGTVVSERVTGQDVTAQRAEVVGRRDAEERAEREARELLSSTDQARLKDVVALRDRLSALQLSVERLRAEATRLERLVSLATVTVSIRAERPAAAEPAKTPPTAGERFRTSMIQAWTEGLAALGSSIAFLVSTLVGGLPWWILVALGALAFKRAWQRRVEAGAV